MGRGIYREWTKTKYIDSFLEFIANRRTNIYLSTPTGSIFHEGAIECQLRLVEEWPAAGGQVTIAEGSEWGDARRAGGDID